jgi:hypothetical protein
MTRRSIQKESWSVSDLDPPGMLTWRKSSFSSSGGCVEVARRGNLIAIRDSKNPWQGYKTYEVEQFRLFIRGIRAGEFDDLHSDGQLG